MATPPRVVARHLPSDAREFLREATPLFLSLSLLNASNYVFHVAVSRMLGPSQYGALAALLAFLLVLSVPCGVLQTAVAKRISLLRAAGHGDEVGSTAIGACKGVAGLAGVCSVAMVLASPLVAALLHVGIRSSVLLGPYVFLALVTSVPLGVLQGELRFGGVGGVSAVGVAVRLASGLWLVHVGVGVPGALLASVLAQAASLALALWLLHAPRSLRRSVPAGLDGIRGELKLTLAALGSFWLLAEADILLARHYLGHEASGLYAVASLVARAVLFLPAAVSLVALPHFAEARDRPAEARRWLLVSLGVTAVLLAIGLAALVLLRQPILRLMFGHRYEGAVALLPVLGLAMACLALVNVIVYFHVAVNSRAHRLILGAVVLEVVLVGLFHGTPRQIAFVVLGVGVLSVAAQWHAAAALLRWAPPAIASPPETSPASVASSPVELSIVLPCRDAGASLGDILTRLLALDGGAAREIIVVSDGSTDRTVEIAREFPPDSVRVLAYPERVGKGMALRVGLAEARGRYVAFMDADGDIDPEGVLPLLTIMRTYEPDIVLASKRHPLSEVAYPPLRRVMSWVYHKLTRVLFRVNVRDTQTGLKLIRRDVLAAVLPRMLEKRYAFDLELLVVARRMGFTGVFEAPVRIDYRFDSRVDPRAAFRILLDTMAVFYRRYVLDTYRPRSEECVARRWGRADLDGHRRILFLNWRDIRNPEGGGAEVMTHEVAKRWVAQGHEVSLMTSRFPGCLPTETVDGVRIRRMGRLRTGSFHLRVQWELAHLRGFDLVIDEINTIPFFTPLWRRRLPPVVGLIHQLAVEVWDAELPRPVAAAGRWLEPRVLSLYRDVPMIAGSESTRRDLEALGIRRVHVFVQGGDEPPVVDGAVKEPVPTFLFVGRLAANKRPDHAVAAFRMIREELPDAKLWIVGRGPLEAAIRESLPPGAELLGFLSREDLFRRMARAHCLLVTSVREGWGLVVTEANSVGTPAVGYDVPGVRDVIVDGRTGMLATASVPAALAEQAAAIVTTAGRYDEIRKRAMEWALCFSWDRTAASVSAAIESELKALDPRLELMLLGKELQ